MTLSGEVNTSVSGGPGTGTITDNDNAPTVSIGNGSAVEGATVSFTVTLSAAFGRTVSVNYGTSDGSATVADSDYTSDVGNAHVRSGWVTSQTITVPTINDTLHEFGEAFSVNLSSPSNATIGNSSATGTINDNDSPPAISIVAGSAVESNGTMTFNVTLSAASGRTVTVNYATSNGSATTPGDYASTSGTLTFNPLEVTKAITVPIVNDALDEPDSETFTVTLSSPSNASIADGSAIGTISDDDPTPVLSVTDAQFEEGTTGTFTLTLSAASGRTVTVTYATANVTAVAPGDYTARTATVVTFAPGETTKTATVTSIEDPLNETNETFRLNLTLASNVTLPSPCFRHRNDPRR